MNLTRIDLEDGRPAEALERCAELDEVAAKMAEGSELAIAGALEALARATLGEGGADSRLAAAVSHAPPPRRQGGARVRPGSVGAAGPRARTTGPRARPCGGGREGRRDSEAAQRRGGRPGRPRARSSSPRAIAPRPAPARWRALPCIAAPLVSAYARARTRALADALEAPLSTIATTETQTRPAQTLKWDRGRTGHCRRPPAALDPRGPSCRTSSSNMRFEPPATDEELDRDRRAAGPVPRGAGRSLRTELRVARSPPENLRLRSRRRRDDSRLVSIGERRVRTRLARRADHARRLSRPAPLRAAASGWPQAEALSTAASSRPQTDALSTAASGRPQAERVGE